jgi:hypothetical protein
MTIYAALALISSLFSRVCRLRMALHTALHTALRMTKTNAANGNNKKPCKQHQSLIAGLIKIF